jgi:serine/threonine protein kinase
MDNRIGQQLGNYRLEQLLGQGGFADVYLGRHVHLNTQAALKILQVQLVGTNHEAFREEARTIATLTHPHIVRILDFGVEENSGIPFLIMDYAPNGSLRQRYLKGSILAPHLIVRYVKEVAAALHYAHQKKLIHRDVKPENILLDAADNALLSDFGLVLVEQNTSSQLTREAAGTLPYTAPEQLQGKPRPASDQYSLGIIVYEWLCGKRPFQGGPVELMGQHALTPPLPLRQRVPNIPPAVEAVVLKALEKDPRQRFEHIDAFAAAFELVCQAALNPMSSSSYLSEPFTQLRASQNATVRHEVIPGLPPQVSNVSTFLSPSSPVGTPGVPASSISSGPVPRTHVYKHPAPFAPNRPAPSTSSGLVPSTPFYNEHVPFSSGAFTPVPPLAGYAPPTSVPVSPLVSAQPWHRRSPVVILLSIFLIFFLLLGGYSLGIYSGSYASTNSDQTPTKSPSPRIAPTSAPLPTSTSTPMPTSTRGANSNPTPTPTTPTPTPTSTPTPAPTPTSTPTPTPTPTSTLTPIPTPTPTPIPTPTLIPTPTPSSSPPSSLTP